MLAEHEADAFNIPSFPIVTVPHPLASLPVEKINQIGAELLDAVVAQLTADGGATP